MALLQVQNLHVAFGDKTVVQDLSFTLEPGQTHALVGESGSGKTVSALSVLQLLPYPLARHNDATSIVFNGTELTGLSHADMRRLRGAGIAMIFQEPMTSLNPLHKVEKQIAESLKLHKGLSRKQARTRVIELLERVGIQDPERRLNAWPHELSGGQRQRVMIAMALANDPKVLIADEPTTALDVTIEKQILDLLKALQKDLDLAILLISHDLSVVRSMAQTVSVMHNGETVEQGKTPVVFDNPQHAYTKMLLSAQPSGRPEPVAEQAAVLLEGQNLKVHFPIKKGLLRRVKGYHKAVQDISFALRSGETLGVVGESGSGKTTLGLALLRLLQSQGEIVFAGQNIAKKRLRDLTAIRSQMQIVFQDPFGSLSPRMSVAQIIGEGLEVHAKDLDESEREAKIAAILKEVGLDAGIQHRYPHEFSGGQRQRIAIARALILRPKFIVLDEPTSALDMTVQSQIVDLLRDLQARYGMAYLFISHDLRVVRALAHQLIVMRDGMVVEQGKAEDVFVKPQHPYTQSLMQSAFGA